MQLNRFCLANNLAHNKLLRLTFHHTQKTLYVNALESYYRSEELGKEIGKKRAEIARSIEIYTVDSFNLGSSKVTKSKEVFERNGMEYIFEGSSIFKMLNHSQKEDVLTVAGRRPPLTKTLKRELKRTHRLVTKTF